MGTLEVKEQCKRIKKLDKAVPGRKLVVRGEA